MRGKALIAVIMAGALIFSGCTVQIKSDGNGWNVGDSGSNIKMTDAKKESNVIDMDGVKKVNLNLEIGVGKMNIEGGSDKLMDGEFLYNIASWKPIVEYSKDGDKGKLSVQQPSVSTNRFPNNARYEWNIKLNKDALFNIDAHMGVGESKLNLSDINLERLTVELGVGKSTIDVSGKYNNDVEVKIEGGIGDTTIYLPKDMNVKIDSETGIGKVDISGFEKNGSQYTSENGGKYKMDVRLEAGIGKISIKQK